MGEDRDNIVGLLFSTFQHNPESTMRCLSVSLHANKANAGHRGPSPWNANQCAPIPGTLPAGLLLLWWRWLFKVRLEAHPTHESLWQEMLGSSGQVGIRMRARKMIHPFWNWQEGGGLRKPGCAFVSLSHIWAFAWGSLATVWISTVDLGPQSSPLNAHDLYTMVDWFPRWVNQLNWLNISETSSLPFLYDSFCLLCLAFHFSGTSYYY